MNLRDIANAATPGPWEYAGGEAGYESVYAHQHMPSWVVADARDNGDADARFIATFDPQLVGRLLDIVDAAREVTEEWHRRGDHGCSVELQVALLDALGATEVTA